MKVRLDCTLNDEKGKKLGEPGDEIDLDAKLAKQLLAGGSAVLVEPPKKSERDL